jgi:cytochrome c biogenesis protein CcdA
MTDLEHVSIFAAFAAGLLSFVSPCVLPLVPSYISYITGLSVERLTDAGERQRFRRTIITNSLLFIAGFSSVFIAFGASASLIGQVLFEYQDPIRKLGGLLIILFGIYLLLEALPLVLRGFDALAERLRHARSRGRLHLGDTSARTLKAQAQILGASLGLAAVIAVALPAGLIQRLRNASWLAFLKTEKRYHFTSRPSGYLGSFLIGTAFAAGWTPCVGPVLGAILAYAGTTDSIASGVILLAFYSLGLGLPLFFTALGVDRFLTYFKQVRTYLWGVSTVSGVLLVAVGVMIYGNSLTMLTSFLERYGIGWYVGQ